MNKQLRISKDLNLPIDAVTGTFCIVGIRGSGKSTTAAVMAEEMLKAKQQIVVLDPKDDWWGLRSSADGKSEGLPVTILGGSHQDAPLEYTAGALVSELILNERISAVISTKHLSDGQRFRFTYDFCDYTYKHCSEPMHLFLDEADQFAPQEKQFKVQKGDTISESMMLSLVRRVIKQGRTSGLGISLITQSPATLDKRVMNMCETLIAMRVVGAQDFDAVERWFKVYLRKKDDLEAIASRLPTLKAGEGVFYSPAWLEVSKVVQFRMAETFDSRKTPKVGERRVEPKVLAPVDLERLSKQMAATIEKVKAEDPKELKKKVRELERQLAVRVPEQPKPVETIRTIEKPVIKDAQLTRLEKSIASLSGTGTKLAETGTILITIAREIQEAVLKVNSNGHQHPAATRAPVAAPPRPQPVAPTPRSIPRSPVEPSGEGLDKFELTLLRKLADRSPVPTTRSQLFALCGFSIKSSNYPKKANKLVEAGCAEDASGGLILTDAGRDYLGSDYEPAPTSGDEALRRWIQKLPAYESGMLAAIAQAGELTSEEIAQATNRSLTSSAFPKAIRNLQGLQFIEGDDPYRLGGIFLE